MELGSLFQLLFGIIATLLTLTGLWVKRKFIKSEETKTPAHPRRCL